MKIFIVVLHHPMDDFPIAAYVGRDDEEAERARDIAFAMALES